MSIVMFSFDLKKHLKEKLGMDLEVDQIEKMIHNVKMHINSHELWAWRVHKKYIHKKRRVQKKWAKLHGEFVKIHSTPNPHFKPEVIKDHVFVLVESKYGMVEIEPRVNHGMAYAVLENMPTHPDYIQCDFTIQDNP